MSKKEFHLSLYQVLFVLVMSWLYTFLTYYMPFEISGNSLCEIYSFQGIPFALILGLILNYYNK